MNTKLVGLSIDSVEDHQGWIKDIQAYNNLEGDFPFPIVADDRTLAVKFGMLDPDELDKKVNFIISKTRKIINYFPGHALDRPMRFYHWPGQEIKTFTTLPGYNRTKL